MGFQEVEEVLLPAVFTSEIFPLIEVTSRTQTLKISGTI